MARGAFRGRGASWVAAVTFAAVGLLRLNTFLVILVAGAVSLWLNRPGSSGMEPAAPVRETDAC
jgi:hypothetical protein